MRVDLVASPVRYRRAPLLLLLAIAVLPAAGLIVLQRWLEIEADQYDDSRAAVAALSGDLSGQPEAARREFERSVQAAALSTTLFDYRRVPDSVARSASASRLEDELRGVLPLVGESSCAAVSVDGTPVGAANETISVVPASTAKLIVAAVALDVLGADYTYETALRAPPIDDGVIDGDIYLVGGGDPLLTSDDYPIEDDLLPAFSTTSLDVLADALLDAGVQRVTGAVLGDGTRYDDEFVIDSWGDGVAYNQAGPYDALLVNDARVRGRGSVQDDPNAGAAREFQRLLGNRGIRVDNGWGSGEASALSRVVATATSQPLGEVVHEMLTNNDNNTAELVLKELGFVESGEGNRFAGLVVVDRVLRSWGIPLDGVRLLDGSGLTPTNEITCRALLAVLQRAQGTALATGLPIAGQTGTLRDEFLDSEIVGRLFAQNGTLSNLSIDGLPLAVEALAGYVSGGNGSSIEFALILNAEEVTDEAAQLIWTLFAERFATFPDGPDRGDLTPR